MNYLVQTTPLAVISVAVKSISNISASLFAELIVLCLLFARSTGFHAGPAEGDFIIFAVSTHKVSWLKIRCLHCAATLLVMAQQLFMFSLAVWADINYM
jgi:hypothetical protein